MKPRQIKIGITLPLAFLALAALVALIFQAGCQAVGMVPVLGTPTSSEKKIPAEYNLAGNKDRKILVLVDQPTYLHTHPNLFSRMSKSRLHFLSITTHWLIFAPLRLIFLCSAPNVSARTSALF
jgi:hypothetical protein